MNIGELISNLTAYTPVNEQEERDKEIILEELKSNENVFFRSSLKAHITVSAWVVNENMDKVLMAYHNIYNSWAWLGGHADGCIDLPSVAIKETKEESGIEELSLYDDSIFSVEILTVSGHRKKGVYVPSHLHLNFTYLLTAKENQRLTIKEDENSGVSWISFDEIKDKSNEPWFVENIYSKLVDKTNKLRQAHSQILQEVSD